MRIIATADWHLCKTVPVCRKETEEEWLDFQFSVVEKIFQTAREYDALLCVAGDIFDRSFPGMRIINRLLSVMKKYRDVHCYFCAGNHETPYHNHNLLIDSGFETIFKMVKETPAIALHHFNGPEPDMEVAEVLLCHHLCFPDRESIPYNVEAYIPDDIAEMYKKDSVIICGDYHGLHSHFVKKYKSYVIVPGCTTIQDADYMNYTPSVLFIDTETLHNEVIHLPNNPDMISREHLEKQKARNEHIDNFIEMLSNKKNVSLSFSDNLKKKMTDKDIPKQVKNIVKIIQERVHGN
mgnify:CR=1 FL=1